MTRRRPFVLAGALLLVALAPAAARAQAPTVTHRNPTQVATAGNQVVRLSGTSFTAGTTVRIGPAGPLALDVRVSGPTSLTFVAPAHEAGAVPLVVDNGAGTFTMTPGLVYRESSTSTMAGATHLAVDYNGRYVAFETGRALVASDTNGMTDVYVLDKLVGRLTRASVSTGGGQATGGESFDPAISANGRFVAFASRATNLVPLDANGLVDVFVHDRDADEDGSFDEPDGTRTERVSVPTGVPEPGAGVSRHPSISGDGRYVVFETTAVLVQGPHTSGRVDLRVRDRLRGLTTRAIAAGVLEAALTHPVISQDGRVVAFQSAGVFGGGTGVVGIYRLDRDADGNGVMGDTTVTERISMRTNLTTANGDSSSPSLTADGRYVVYQSVATNLDSERPDTNGESDVFIWDNVARATRRLSVDAAGVEFSGPSLLPSISANGLRAVFLTSGLDAPSGAAVAGGLDDGRRTLAVLVSPTTASAAGPVVMPPVPGAAADAPAVSGDGTDVAWIARPPFGSGQPDPTGFVAGVRDEIADEPVPLIAGFQPAHATTAGGVAVDIEGENFLMHFSDVLWGGTVLSQPGQVTFLSPNRLRVVAPPSAAGPIAVRVRTWGVDSDAATFTCTNLTTPPAITSISPETTTVGGPATSMTITGSGFSLPTVRFGDVAVVPTTWTPTSISVTVPDAFAAGAVPVVVSNLNGTAARAPVSFVYASRLFDPVTITSVAPATGPATGGTVVQITGTGFRPGSEITIGGAPARDVQVLSSSTILATAPPGTPGAREVWLWQVGLPRASSAFTYTEATTPPAHCAGTDADGDQIADAWESQYGLSPGDPSDGVLDWDGDGRTNLQECEADTHPRGLYTRYLAEGATGSFFSTRVALANPGAQPAHVLLRFVTGAGTTVPYALTVPATARRTFDLAAIPGLASANVSTIVESDAEVVVDRTVRWDLATRYGAHAESSVPAPALRWYLAEGATHGSFDLFYLIANPSATTAADVEIRFLRPAPAAPVVRSYVVAPNSRFTLPVDAVAGLEATDVSGVVSVTNGVPVIVERAMYSSAAGTFAAGHDAAGVTAPATRWFFAEGATGAFFDTFLLLANPGATDATVTIRYLLAGGEAVERTHVVAANSRRTILVAGEAPQLANAAVSAIVTATNGVPIIAERSMWWPHGANWVEAHAAAGATTAGRRWAVADGEVGEFPDDAATFLLIANTDTIQIAVTVTLLFEAGPPVTKQFFPPANSRFNVAIVSTEVPDGPGVIRVPRGTRFSAIVEAIDIAPFDSPIVVERAMYWNANGQLWSAGSDLLATKLQ